MANLCQFSLKDPKILFVSFLGVGFCPYAPGTVGTLAFLPFLYLLSILNLSLTTLIIILIFFTIISIYITDNLQKKYKLHDPQWIVIDEVLGIITAYLFVNSSSLLALSIIFILFRFFDIVKIWPASYFDKKVTHGAGTILDDIISGIYAGSIYYLFTILA